MAIRKQGTSNANTMNTPKQPKAPKRWDGSGRKLLFKGGTFGIVDPEIAAAYGQINAYWPHVENRMVSVLADLISGRPDERRFDLNLTVTAQAIFWNLVQNKAKIDIMKALLENVPHNIQRENKYDEIIKEFSLLNGKRNKIVHGLWMTEHKTNDLCFWESRHHEDINHRKPDRRGVKKKDFDRILSDMRALMTKILTRHQTKAEK